MINRPNGIGAFKFAVLASLRAAQLCRGCVPRVEGHHSVAITAQMEVAGGVVNMVDPDVVAPAEPPELTAPVAAARI